MPRIFGLLVVGTLTAMLAACSSSAPSGPQPINQLSGDVPAGPEQQSKAPLPVFPMFNTLLGF